MQPHLQAGDPPFQKRPGLPRRHRPPTTVRCDIAIAFLAIAWVLATTACSFEEHAAVVSDSLVAEQCLLSDVTWADPASRTTACTGPWTYETLTTETSRDALCGVEQCLQRGSCEAWDDAPPIVHTSTWSDITACDIIGREFVCAPHERNYSRCDQYVRDRASEFRPTARTRFSRSSPRLNISPWQDNRPSTIQVTCSALIYYQEYASRVRDTCSCVTEQYHSCLHATSQPRRIVTAAGLTQTQVRGSHDARGAGQRTSEQIAPVCSTAEDVPNSQPDAKLLRLLGSYADPAIAPAGSPLRDEIVRRIKASYELLGERMQPASDIHRRVLAIYQQHPDVSPACGREASSTQVCDPEADWRLKLCTRLTSNHVDAALVSLRYDDCLQELAALGDAIDGGRCSGEHPYVEASVDVHRRLMESLLFRFATRLAALPRTGEVPTYDTAMIGEMLNRIDRWFPRVGRILRDEQRAYRELALTTNKFWQAAHGYIVSDGAATEWHDGSIYDDLQNRLNQAQEMADEAQARVAVETALGLTELRGLALDRAVLSAAYGSTGTPSRPVLTSAPLLRITADALAPLVDRLDALVQFHDVGCALANCASFARPTKLSRFWKVLSRLISTSSQPPSLEEVLRDPWLGDLNGWAPVFARIRDGQPRLVQAIDESRRAAAGRDRELQDLIEAAGARISAYEATVLFLPAVGDVLQDRGCRPPSANV